MISIDFFSDMAIPTQNAQFNKTVDYMEPVYKLFQYKTQLYLKL